MFEKPKYKVYLTKDTTIPENFERFVFTECNLVYANSFETYKDTVTLHVLNENALTKEITDCSVNLSMKYISSIEPINTKYDQTTEGAAKKKRGRPKKKSCDSFESSFNDDTDYENLYDIEE